jgi:EmrB/QacA subfamily drug resistance transporter
VALVFFTMPATRDERDRPFDALGVLTMASCIIPLLLALSEGRRYGWHSQMILTLFLVSAVSLVAFIITELKTHQPFVNIRLYQNVPFAMGCLITFINTTEFRGTNFLLPIMLQRIYHYSPFQTGLFFLPPALIMGVTSIVAGRLSDSIQPKALLTIGILALCYASLQFCQVDIWTTAGVLLELIILRRAAQAFCNAPLSSSTLRGVPEDQVRMASGLFTFHRTLGGAAGVALSATLLKYRQDVHLLLLSEQQALYPLGTAAATDTIRTMLMQEGLRDDLLTQMTTDMLRRQLTAEAALAGYHDMFVMFACLALCALIPVLLLRRVELKRGEGNAR